MKRILLDLDKSPAFINGDRLRQRDVNRFLAKFDRSDPSTCWEYPGASVDGYVQVRTGKEGRFCQAHRLSWILSVGDIPPGLLVLHTCDNRRCVNPKHLFLGTYLDNAKDRESKGRGNQPKGSENGWATLTEEMVAEIRRLYVKGKKGNTKMLKKMFNISQPTVYRVGNGLTWRHV